MLSIVIPALNERASLPRILARVLDVDLPCKRQIIVVDDGSTDGTLDAISAILRDNADVMALRLPKQSGKGSAIRAAIPHVSGDFMVIQDADEEYDPRDLPCLVRPLIDGRVRAVYGSRVINEHVRRQRRYTNPFWYGGRALTLLANLLYPVCRISDEPVGYKLVRMDLMRTIPLRCTGFEFCPELTAKLSRRGVRIFSSPINYSPRSMSAGKKIRPKHFFEAVWTLIKYRFKRDHGKEDQLVADAWAASCGAEVFTPQDRESEQDA